MKTAVRWGGWISSLVFLVGMLLFARPTWLLGGDTSTLIVSGHSMDGTYRTGDIVMVKEQARYAVGDIVGFQVPAGEAGEGMVVIHRIVAEGADGFTTQGDNNPDADPWKVSATDMRGRAALRVPALGNVTGMLRGPLGIAGIFGGLASWVAFGLLDPREGKEKDVTRSSRRGARTRLRRAATSRPAS